MIILIIIEQKRKNTSWSGMRNFGPANLLYSSNIEFIERFCNFLKQPIKHPTRC